MTDQISFETLDNFRDFGGYAAGARRMKRGLLFRSAHHAHISEQELERLAGLRIRVVVDLRRPEERARMPSRRWAAFDGHVIENDVGEQAPESFARRMAESEDSFRAFMRTYYEMAPFETRHVDLYSRYFQTLAATDGALLVHCAAGKDRTGILCALTQHIAGVHRDDILHDYLKTNDEGRLSRRGPEFAKLVEQHTGIRVSDAMIRLAMSVDAQYLDTAFAEIAKRHGDLDGYLEQTLGVDAGKREAILERVLD